MVVVGDRVIGSFAVLSRGALDELLDRIVRRELKPLHPCIIFLVLVWFFSLGDLELMVIFMTSSSSSKTDFTCIFYDVFDVGGYAGSSLLEVSLLCLLSIPPLPLLTTRCLVSHKLEFAQFGAHLQKLWQFWFPSGSTAARAAIPLIAPSGSTTVQSGSTAYGHKR